MDDMAVIPDMDEPDDVMPSEISQVQEDKHCRSVLMWGI